MGLKLMLTPVDLRLRDDYVSRKRFYFSAIHLLLPEECTVDLLK